MKAAEELAQITGVTTACQVLKVPRSSLYRAASGTGQLQPKTPAPSSQRRKPRHKWHRALSDAEKKEVRNVLNSERFQDQSPREVYAALLDDGVYLCHWRTMYRILDEHDEVRERRNQLRHPVYAKPELLRVPSGRGPNQLWSWDITKLRGPVTWTYYYLYVMLDVFSR
jgi:putative transposase